MKLCLEMSKNYWRNMVCNKIKQTSECGIQTDQVSFLAFFNLSLQVLKDI